MFDLFFMEYKNIRKNNKKKPDIVDIVFYTLAVLIIVAFSCTILIASEPYKSIVILSTVFVLLVIEFIGTAIQTIKSKRALKSGYENYNSNDIQELRKLLDKYHINCNDGIDWAIKCTYDNRVRVYFRKVFEPFTSIWAKIILPVINSRSGIPIKNSELKVSDTCLLFVIIIMIMVLPLALLLSSILYLFGLTAEKLREDLEYLKSREDKKYPQSVLPPLQTTPLTPPKKNFSKTLPAKKRR